MVPLDQFPDVLLTVPLRPQFLQSVRENGVEVPISLIALPDGPFPYTVKEGRRRILAARAAGYTEIPAYIEDGEAVTAGLRALVGTVALNHLRSQNRAAELDAIARLAAEGYDERAIARATGMSVSQVRGRLAIVGSLVPGLRAAVAAGKLVGTVADEASKLPAVVQAGLVARLAEKGRLTATDIHDAKTARRQAALADLAGDIFTEDTGASSAHADWRGHVRSLVESARAAVPGDEVDLSALLDAGLALIGTERPLRDSRENP